MPIVKNEPEPDMAQAQNSGEELGIWQRFRVAILNPFRYPRGLASKIYIAFLLTSVIPTSIAGVVGIFYSLDVLKSEMLLHLEQEAASRAEAQTNFFRQLSSELLYLASSSSLGELAGLPGHQNHVPSEILRQRIKRDFSAFATAYPHIYQIRYLDAKGREVVRVDRRDERIYVVPDTELQDKSGRYYVEEISALDEGEIYISPLDLNIEGGVPEVPERPVIRFGTPVINSKDDLRGLLIINLHADIILGQVQQMANARGGDAYLFNRSGFYLARTADAPDSSGFRMKSIEDLSDTFPRPMLARIIDGHNGAVAVGDWIVAFAPIMVSSSTTLGHSKPLEWAIVLAYPREKLFAAVFSLYILYGVLTIALIVTAVGGGLLSRHLLRPLASLMEETEEIAKGNFLSRVEVRGKDEISQLGSRFNSMAERLEHYYAALEDKKLHLESEVQARTAALERERKNLATIIQNTADGILSLTADGVVELANAAARQLLVSGGGDLTGTSFTDVWPGWEAYQREIINSGAVSRRLDISLLGRQLALSLSPVGGGASVHGYIVVVRDVSEERRLQDERRELDRQLFQMEKMTTMGELAMGLAHEIGNPLTGMKTVVQALQTEELDAEMVARYLSRIEGEVDRLSSFLHTFHGFAAPHEMHPGPCRLEDVLEDVLLWTRKEARSLDISIDYKNCVAGVPELWADPYQLKQLLLNLVINAIHATPRGGRILIGMCGPIRPEDRNRHVPRMRFCIDDTGEGIPADVLPKIFDPFYTTREGGSGLGLAVVKKIAVQHGADIHVESTVGKGTRFVLVWPLADAEVKEDPCPSLSGECLDCERSLDHG